MRIATFILSLVMFVLGFVPCADANRLPEGNTQTMTQNHEHNSQHNDECTPLCSCACCSVPYYQVHLDPVTIAISNLPEPVYAAYLSSPVIKISASIWQPPRF